MPHPVGKLKYMAGLWAFGFALLLQPEWNPSAAEPDGNPKDHAAARVPLERFNELIGDWRGTAQPRRGSSQGAWQQTSRFVWDFSGETPAIRYEVTNGKLVQSARLSWNPEAKLYELRVVQPDQSVTPYTGSWEDGKLVLISSPQDDKVIRRMTITPLNEKRTLILHERTAPGGSQYLREAEVGYTRAGTHLADSGSPGRECVVTGGSGTIEVSYKGETYFVCCSGCKQAFDDDPETILAEFRERVRQRRESTR